MKNAKLALLAAFLIALAFTFSCSSGGDNGDGGGTSSPSGGGSSSPSGGGIPFDENSQIYKSGSDAPYTGSGIIVINLDSEDDFEGEIELGSVTDGIVNLKLPSTIPDEWLTAYPAAACTESPSGLKYFGRNSFTLTGEDYGRLRITYQDKDKQIRQDIQYVYFSKAGKITCNDEKRNRITNINAKVGWNKIYMVVENDNVTISTDNILTKKVNWTISQ